MKARPPTAHSCRERCKEPCFKAGRLELQKNWIGTRVRVTVGVGIGVGIGVVAMVSIVTRVRCAA